MHPLRAPKSKHLAILLIVAAAMIVLYGRIDYVAEPFSTWDLASYRVMAAASPGIATDVARPLAFRILGPYLAGLLPLPDPAGFYALAVALSLVLVVLFHRFLRSVGIPPTVSLITAVLFTLNRHWFGFTVWDYFQLADLLSMIFLIVLFRAMYEDRWVLFGIALLLGAVTRETCLLMLPVAAVYLLEEKKRSQAWRKALVAAVPGVAAFLVIRALVPTAGGQTLAQAMSEHAGKILSPETLFRLLVNADLPFSLVPLVFIGGTIRFLRARKHALVLLALVFLSTLFGSNNERLMAPAFIVVYPLIGTLVSDAKPGRTFLGIAIGGGFLSSLHHVAARYPLPDVAMTRALSLGALLIVTLASIAVRVGRRARGGVIRRSGEEPWITPATAPTGAKRTARHPLGR